MQYASLATIHTVQAEFLAVLQTIGVLMIAMIAIGLFVFLKTGERSEIVLWKVLWPEKPKKRRP